MKRLLFLLAAALICFSFSGCSSIDAVGDAQQVLSEYVDEYNANNVQEEINCFHGSLIEALGGDESTATILASRRAILGEITGYEITNTAFETINKTTEVVLTLSVDYENFPGAEDTYTFLTVDKSLYITGLELEDEANVDAIITGYYSDYADSEARKAYYIPYAAGLIGDAFELDSRKIEALAGGFAGYDVLSKNYVVIQNEEASDVVCYMIMSLEVSYENMTFISDFQLGGEGGKIGINYEVMLPETISDFKSVYEKALTEKAKETLLSLYSPAFFGGLSEYSRDGWWDFLYAPMLSDYGILKSYEVVEWDWDTVELSGEQTDCFIIYSQAEYESMVIQEKIIVSADNGEILGHYVQQAG